MEDFVYQRKILVLVLVKQTQNFAWVYINGQEMEKKSSSLKSTIKMLTFQLSFVLEAYLMDLVLLSLEKYL